MTEDPLLRGNPEKTATLQFSRPGPADSTTFDSSIGPLLEVQAC